MMRRREVDVRPFWNHAGGINGGVTLVIMVFYVFEINGFGNPVPLIELTRKAPQIGHVDNTLQITFEMSVVNRVETYQCGKQPPVGFGDAITR